MTHRERFVRTLTGQAVDRVPFIKVFGGTNATVPAWEKECPGISENVDKLLKFEGEYRGWQNTPVEMEIYWWREPKLLHEDAATQLWRRSDGSVIEVHKGEDFNSFIRERAVKSRADWQRIKKQLMNPDDPERFPKDWPEYVARYNKRDYPLQLRHGGVYGFARVLMGDEALCYAFYDDPQFVREIMDTHTDMVLAIWRKMVRVVQFDLIEVWEDMAYRGGSLISPKIFREFMKPNYMKIADFARQNGIGIILVDSDGYIEDLTELMLESGVTALYPFEVQAGNDLDRVRERFPTVGAIGGLNKNVMAQGKREIDAEIERARGLILKGRFIPGPDHFVLSDVSWENYRYFMEKLRMVVMTTKPYSPSGRLA